MVDHIKCLTEVDQYTPDVSIRLQQGVYTISEIDKCTLIVYNVQVYKSFVLNRYKNQHKYLPVFAQKYCY